MFLQFVPGTVTTVYTEKYSVGNLKDEDTNGIWAIPDDGYAGTPEDQGNFYRPLLRGITDVPNINDKVLLCTFSNSGYYMGPLNSENNPNINKDTESNSIVSEKHTNFQKKVVPRLQKINNIKLDRLVSSNTIDIDNRNLNSEHERILSDIHGDMVFEGRHGNSLRIGSRSTNPYIIFSNARPIDLSGRYESTLDGTLMGMFNNGTLRDHFFTDMSRPDLNSSGAEKYEFTLADEEFTKTLDNPDMARSIVKTYAKPLGSGKKDGGEDDINISDKIYGYDGDQFLLTSDRITFNSKRDSIFISSFKHIHIGCGSSMTFSTSDNIFIQAARSVVTNVPMFKVNANTVRINGTEKIVLGNPMLGDFTQQAVKGSGLTWWLVALINEIQNLCWDVSQAVENHAAKGGSVDIMFDRSEAFLKLLGNDDYIAYKEYYLKSDPLARENYETNWSDESVDGDPTVPYPSGLARLILSNKVWLK
jgi:hypothetical protein